MRRDVRLLGDILGEVIRDSAGDELLADVERLRHAVIDARHEAGMYRAGEVTGDPAGDGRAAVLDSPYRSVCLLAYVVPTMPPAQGGR